MDFPAKEVNYLEIHASSFNAYIVATFKTEYHYADTMDYPPQDTYQTYDIGSNSCGDQYYWNEDYTEEYEEMDLERLFQDLHNGEKHKRPSPEELMEAMYQMKMIPAGEYLFTVWW